MCFPIILGTFFYMAFSNIYDSENVFHCIPVAIVENQTDEFFNSAVEQLSEGESPLFNAVYTDSDSAEQLLKDGDVTGIIYVGDTVSLSVTSSGIAPSIIKSFLEEYQAQKTIITNTAMNNPEKLQDVLNALTQEVECISTNKLTSGNMDVYVQYFFNLIAMVILLGSTTGMYAATDNQANLSAVGARKYIAPMHNLVSIIGSLLAAFCVQVIFTFVSITFILFVLRVNMGDKIPLIYVSGAAGSLLGVSFGFFIGSVGRISEAAKGGIASAVSMLFCFMSGLMIGDIKTFFEENCPIVNRINPAAVISDTFYCLALYDDYSRYIEKILTVLALSVILTAGGFLLTRRKKYDCI
jgi:ABC-2 type transport system permease protein